MAGRKGSQTGRCRGCNHPERVRIGQTNCRHQATGKSGYCLRAEVLARPAPWRNRHASRRLRDKLAGLHSSPPMHVDVLVEGQSGILAVSTPWFRPVYESSKRRVTWPNGAIATTFSAEEPIRAASHIARQVRIRSAAAGDVPLSGDYRDM